MISSAQLFGDGFAQLGYARRRCVARLVFIQRSLHRFFDRSGRRHERLATLELVDSCAFAAQLHDAVAKFDDIGKTDLLESRSKAENRWRGCHYLARFLPALCVGTADYSS